MATTNPLDRMRCLITSGFLAVLVSDARQLAETFVAAARKVARGH